MKKPNKRRDIDVFGVCQTFFFNACDRKARLPEKRRPCYMAYYGHGRTYKTRRFPIDTLGDKTAYKAAVAWRAAHAPLDKRSCDVVKRKRGKR